MGGLNEDLGYVYRVFFKVTGNQETGENIEEFGVRKLNIRNINNAGYRYYDEKGETQSISKELLGGVFMTYGHTDKPPYLMSWFITDDEEMYKLISGEVPPKSEDEQKGLEDLKTGLQAVVIKSMENMIQYIKDTNETIVKNELAKHECTEGGILQLNK